jgi:Domain of unknown function (DUF4372)
MTSVVTRHKGDSNTLTSGDFPVGTNYWRWPSRKQLTYRESLRDIESCLRALQRKLYHMWVPRQSVALDSGRCERIS